MQVLNYLRSRGVKEADLITLRKGNVSRLM